MCTACDGTSGYQDQSGQTSCKSVSSCASNQYTKTLPTSSSDRECADCTTSSSCKPNEYLTGTCGGQSNTYCSPCHSTCASCSGAGSNQCLSCTGSLVLHQGQCLSNCPVGRYADSKGVCQQCDSSCYSCSAAGDQACTACSGSLYLNSNSGQCVSSCPGGYYRVAKTNDNRCQACTVCANGNWSSTPCGLAADTECSIWSECSIGQQVVQEPSNTKNRKQKGFRGKFWLHLPIL